MDTEVRLLQTKVMRMTWNDYTDWLKFLWRIKKMCPTVM